MGWRCAHFGVGAKKGGVRWSWEKGWGWDRFCLVCKWGGLGVGAKWAGGGGAHFGVGV